MALRTVQQYVESLRDGRTVYFRGARVDDVTTHPVIGVAVRHAAIDYEMAEDPAHRDLATVTAPDGERYSRYYHVPRSAEDQITRSALIERATALGGTLVVLIKEIGTDALFSLLRTASAMDARGGAKYLPRVEAFYRALPHQRSGDGRRADRRQGRPLARAVGSGRSRHVRAHRRAAQRRHRRARAPRRTPR